MLIRLNQQLQKRMPLITPASVVIGVLLANYLADFSFLVPWIFAFMTFSGSLSSNFHSMKKAILHPIPILIVLTILHVIMPLWALGIGKVVFQDDVYTITGLILSVIIPTGITSFIWVSLYKGNIALTLSIILIDTMLSPVIVPTSLSLLVGSGIEMDVWRIMKGLLGMIVIPSIIGMSLNHFTKGRVEENWVGRLAPFAKLSLATVVILNSAVIAPYLIQINLKLVMIGIVVFFVAFSGYFISWVIGGLLKREKEDIMTMTFTGGMRNISTGAVIAIAYFPPPVAVPVVVGMLFQQVLASPFGLLIDRYYNKKTQEQRVVV
ncbi:bile acid:sodium symporter family protein [Aquibacillus sp. 3ASR75-11]|uniref:Bile acid:sodium symporter family protein n=1 Tax=Terrihalobacillus insolitus TaxID=2950438 RepID=A0A9X4APL3_9BACI|nr:bile acid:sodium symporter family protein [Terrihalobacillus insolitus]MDC3413268.1 bile acid:sodium symporter family protein [Terrihalobacillus insolitus]MDC3425678.1 bile acid:sodium symporter family protein [Terrihalobacillus insolitus]